MDKAADEIAYFAPSVYQERLDEVLAHNWESVRDGSDIRITLHLHCGQSINRTGKSFIEACEMFGVGRYVHDIPPRRQGE